MNSRRHGHAMAKDVIANESSRRPSSVESARRAGRGGDGSKSSGRKLKRPTSSITSAEHELEERKARHARRGKRAPRVKVVAAVSMQERLHQQKLELERRQAMHAWAADEGPSRRTTKRRQASGAGLPAKQATAKIDIEQLRQRSRARQERLRRDSSFDLLLPLGGPAESKVSRFGGAILSMAAEMADGDGVSLHGGVGGVKGGGGGVGNSRGGGGGGLE